MRATRTYLYSCALILLWVFCLSPAVTAQSRLAVMWDPPANDIQASNEIAFLKSHTTELIIMSYPQRDYVLAELERQSMPYIMDASLEYVTESLLQAGESTIQRQITDVMATEIRNSAFKGVLLFSHSQSYRPDFVARAQGLIEETGYRDSTLFLVHYQSTLRNLITGEILGDFKSYTDASEHSLFDFTRQILSTQGYLIIDQEWLEVLLSEFPVVESALLEASSLNQAIIPLPEIPSETPLIHWSVIVLLLIWISFAVNVNLNPTYQETILRYFIAHRFYVDDILGYRERSSISGIFLLFQHALFGGLATYVMAKTYITQQGLSALFQYLPQLGIMGQNYFSLFVVVSLIVFLIEVIALAWLYLPNPGLSHLNQVLNLYTWIFHLDFILVSLMVVLFFAGASSVTLTTLAVIYVLIWFASFNITALDSSKRLGPNRSMYLLKTILLHTITAITIVIILAVLDGWMEVADLVINV